MDTTESKKIVLLNETTLDSMMEKDSMKIIKNFTEVGIKILDADFGFAWWKFDDNEEYRLAYNSHSTPYEPTIPRENAGNYIARTTKKPFFDSSVKKENYEYDISRYLKSYIIVPIYYNEIMYGSLVLCYEKEHSFSEDELNLAIVLGTTTAQAITINRLLISESEARILSEKQVSQMRALEEERLKIESIADATHELRTPLAIIKGNIDLVLMKMGPSTKKFTDDVLTNIDIEVKHLSGIVSDLALLTSQVDHLKNSKEINKHVDVSKLVATVVKRFKTVADKNNISMRMYGLQKAIVFGNEAHLEKLFSNLIRNAITYGREGGWVKIYISKKGDYIEIQVEDNGIGIPEEDIPHIFNRFYRGDKSHSSERKGNGLGLAIVKWVTEMHGGTISVSSSDKKGSIFTVSLPTKSITLK